MWLLSLVFFSSMHFGWSDDGVVLTVETAEEESRLRRFLENLARDEVDAFEPELELDLGTVGLMALSSGITMDSLTPDSVQHDIDRLYHDFIGARGNSSPDHDLDYWNRLSITAAAVVPLELGWSNLVGPFGLSLGVDVGEKRTFQIISKTNRRVRDRDSDLGPTLARKLLMPIDTLKAIRIPRTAASLMERYSPGAEISESGYHYVLTSVGVSAGIPVFTAGTSVSALVYGKLKRTAKVLYADDRKLVNLVISSEKGNTLEQSASLYLSLSLFETSVIDGALKINFLAASRSRTKSDSLLFDYTYDLSYPNVRKALDSALLGDMRATERLAVFRTAEDLYQGVAINRQRTEAIQKAVKSFTGFSITGSQSGVLLFLDNLAIWEKISTFWGFFQDSRSETWSHGEVENENTYREKGVLETFSYQKSGKQSFLWGRWGKHSWSISASSQVVKTDIVEDDVGIRTIETNKLTYSNKQSDRMKHARIKKEFYDSAQKVLGWNNPRLGESIKKLAQSQSCNDPDLSVSVSATFHDRAIDNILSWEEPQIWVVVGKLIDLPKPIKLRYDSTRESVISLLESQYWGIVTVYQDSYSRWKDSRFKHEAFERFPDAAHSEEIVFRRRLMEKMDDLDWRINLLRGIERKFLPLWRDARENKTDPHALAPIVRDWFSVMKGSQRFLDLLAVLASMEYRLEKDPERFGQGATLRYSLSGEGCEFSFRQSGDVLYQFGDPVRDWN